MNAFVTILLARVVAFDFFSAITFRRIAFVAVVFHCSSDLGLFIATEEVSSTSSVVKMVGGDVHSMILKEDGSVWSCGLNLKGQLGIPSIMYAAEKFEQTTISSGAIDIAAGLSHSLVLKQDGGVWKAGATSGIPDAKKTEKFVFVRVIPGAEAIFAGGGHSLVLAQHGSVWATGLNLFGQLGDGTYTDREKFIPVISSGSKTAAAGHAHSIVLKVDGSVWVAGWNGYGQLGYGKTTNEGLLFVQVMSSGVAVAAGAYHSIVIQEDGSVWTTGCNVFGQLGDGTAENRNHFTMVERSAKSVAAGVYHSLLLKQDGSVWTTLFNVHGQVGDFSGFERGIFVQVMAGGGKAVATGGYHSMVLKEDGTMWAAGSNKFGQIGYNDEYRDGIRNFVRVGPSGNVVEQDSPALDIPRPKQRVPISFPINNMALTAGTVKISLGAGHSFIVKKDGSLYAAGGNVFGQLGTELRMHPVTNFVPVFTSGVSFAAAGGGHSLVLKQDGSVWATGRNKFGQLGDASNLDREMFFKVIPSGATAVAAGAKHSLVVKRDGSVWAAGCNWHGQLGDGSTADKSIFVQVLLRGLHTVSAGADHSLALGQDGSVWATGANVFGQLGDGSTTLKTSFLRVHSAGAKGIAAGGHHSMMLMHDDTVWTVGDDESGQLGDGSHKSRSVMKQVRADAKAIAAGLYHSIVLGQDGSVWATGNNNGGQLGDGSTIPRSGFVMVVDRGAQAVAAGGWHSMVMKRDGSFWATGENEDGQLGDDSMNDKVSFVRVAQTRTHVFARIALGIRHSVIVKKDGSVWAAGWNVFGQLGTGTTTNQVSNFVEVLPGSANVAIAGGGKHSMVMKSDGSVWTTGRNTYGQLGDGTNDDRDSFVKVVSDGAKAVASGARHSVVMKDDGSVWASGCNLNGQLGDGSSVDSSVFIKVFLKGVEAISAGSDHTLVLGRDGSVWATGANYFGQLGDASTTSTQNFVSILPAGAKAIAAGGYHSMVIEQDGTVWVTGANQFGQLGDGSKTSRKTMVQITDDLMQPFNAKSIAAGLYHSMVLKHDGSLWSTGRNDLGQLGDGSRVYRSAYVPVLTGVQAVAAGGWHSMVLKLDGSFWASGKNSDGQLGDGSTADRIKFIKVARVKQISDDESDVVRTTAPSRKRTAGMMDVALAVRRRTTVLSPSVVSPACPKCGATKIPGKLSCCGRGGAWFLKCGDVDKHFEHTWTEGVQACATFAEVSSTAVSASRGASSADVAEITSAIGSVDAAITTVSGVMMTPNVAAEALVKPSASVIMSERCPKCGTSKKSGKSSCCVRGGAWFKRCGDPDDETVEHTWYEGFQACKTIDKVMNTAASVGRATMSAAPVSNTAIPSITNAAVPVATRESAARGESETCSKCGTMKGSGKLSCCARNGAWHQKCGAAGDKNVDHTWVEGVQACNLFGASMFFEAVEQVRLYRASEQSINEIEPPSSRGIPEQHTNAQPTANASDVGINAGVTDGEERVGFAKFGVLANILFINLYLQM